MQGTEDTATNQKNPDFVLRELSLLRKKASEPGVTAELCPIKKDLSLMKSYQLKQPWHRCIQKDGTKLIAIEPLQLGFKCTLVDPHNHCP